MSKQFLRAVLIALAVFTLINTASTASSDPFLGATPTISGTITSMSKKGASLPVFTHIDDSEEEQAISGCTSAFSTANKTVRFTLKTPPAAWLEPITAKEGITVTPRDAKGFSFDEFSAEEGGRLRYMKDLLHTASFWYVDRDVTMSGTLTKKGAGSVKFDLKLKRGWNVVISEATASGRTASILLRSGVPSSDYTWLFSY